MTILSPYTYPQTIGSGHAPQWVLHISKWGNRGAAGVAGDLAYSGSIPGGCQYVAIGPDSTVSEAIISFNQVGPFSTVALAPTPGQTAEGALTVGVGAPLGPLAGALGVRVAMQGQYGDTYFQDGATAASNFGDAEAKFEAPELQLIFFGPTARVVTVGRRAPMLRVGNLTVPDAAGTKTLVAIWPVSGRGSKRVSARCNGTLVGTFTVGLISYVVTTVVGVAVTNNSEVQATPINVSAVTGAAGAFESSVPCQFLAVYFTRSAGGGDFIAELTAIDPPV